MPMKPFDDPPSDSSGRTKRLCATMILVVAVAILLAIVISRSNSATSRRPHWLARNEGFFHSPSAAAVVKVYWLDPGALGSPTVWIRDRHGNDIVKGRVSWLTFEEVFSWVDDFTFTIKLNSYHDGRRLGTALRQFRYQPELDTWIELPLP